MFKKLTLKNNLRLVLAPIKHNRTVTVLVAVATGSKYENKKTNGLSHFLEHMLFKGSKKRPTTLAIAESLDRVGGDYNAFTGKEVTGYWAKVASEHFDLALDVVADVFMNPKIPAPEIEKERGVIVEEINMYQDMPMSYVGILFEQLLYGDTPAGWPTIGPKENILRFKRNDFLEYMHKQYVAGNTVVCIAGDLVKIQNPKSKIQNYFKNIITAEPHVKEAVHEKQSAAGMLLHEKKTDQTHLCLGVRAYDLFHKNRYAMQVLSVLLGGSMSSRLFMELREKRGLAYYVSTRAEMYTDSGFLMTQCGVPNNRVEEAIKVVMAEYGKMASKKLGAKELKKAKDYLKGKTTLNLESSDEISSYLVEQEIMRKEILTPKEHFAKLDKVTVNDIQRVARDIFKKEKLNLAMIGPGAGGEKFKSMLAF